MPNANQPGKKVLDRIEADLSRFPGPTLERFKQSRHVLEGRLSEETLHAWAEHGLQIARKTVRSWEAAAEYFAVSPEVQRQLPSGQFVRWAASGASLSGDSPNLAVSFFRASPGALSRLRPRYIDDWVILCRSLYRGTWKSSALCCRFCESTPDLLETLTFSEFTQFGQFLETLSLRSYDLAGECLTLSTSLLPKLGGESEAFITVARTLAHHSWRDVRAFFDVAETSLARLDGGQRVAFLALADRLIVAGHGNPGEFIRDGVAALNRVSAESQGRIVELSQRLLAVDPAAVPEFFRSAPSILERVSFAQFEEWNREGLDVLRENSAAGISYYRAESAHSEQVLEALSSGVELNRVRDIIRMYCRALSGRDIEVQAAQQLVEKNIGWVEGDTPTTEGTTIYLPSAVNRFTRKDLNFGWYKVVSTHQVGHIEFGSFDFEFDRASTMFDDLRAEIIPPPQRRQAAASQNGGLPPEAGPRGGIETAFLTDMSRFFGLFVDEKLALDIFTVVEDTRLDARLMHEYKGIAPAYKATQERSIAERPDFIELPMREAMLELIVRLSLYQREGLKAPKEYRDTALKISRIVRRLADPSATVEDAGEATIRIYSLLSEVPNEEIDEEDFEDIDLDDDEESSGQEREEDREEILQSFGGNGQEEGAEQGDQGDDQEEGTESYESPKDVDYRGEFKPELAQLLSQMMGDGGEDGDRDGEPGQITAEQLEEMLRDSPELDTREGEAQEQQQTNEMLENLLKELARRESQNQQTGQGSPVHVDEEGGPLSATEPDTFTYDEWDFRANEYKRRWCLVHEKQMADGEATFYHDTLTNYASLMRDIRRQFELVVPEMYRKVKRLEDGEEHDLDSVIEAVTDIRSGATPSEKLYWRRNKLERSVAVAFLLDMSASTAEAIDEARKVSDDWGAPDDPVEYMVWLRSRRAEGLRRSYKRIVDIEKEGIVLLVNALETMGDSYGIYGFSGYGRENVEFYVIKDIEERFSRDIPRRIDRIAPLHATRMGPAIRHTTTKLLQQDARSRFLFLISDGRPQDRGYSREGVEKEYAVHDTKMALTEAKREGITPFCLTVDKAGHDYLKTMMQDMSYEVLPDINLLPQRLPLLYRRLTT